MLPSRRTRFLLLACCAFLALLCLGASAASGTRTYTSTSYDMTRTSTTFVVDGASLVDSQGSWHANLTTPSPSDFVVNALDSDVDDDPAMPVSPDLRVDHPRFVTPAGVIPSLLVSPAAPLLRPPSLA